MAAVPGNRWSRWGKMMHTKPGDHAVIQVILYLSLRWQTIFSMAEHQKLAKERWVYQHLVAIFPTLWEELSRSKIGCES
jgi:hypothetical protein